MFLWQGFVSKQTGQTGSGEAAMVSSGSQWIDSHACLDVGAGGDRFGH